MNTKIAQIVITLIIVLTVMMFAGCGLLREIKTISDSRSEIYGKTKIGKEWIEIVPPAPLSVVAKRHKVSIRTDAVEGFDEKDGTHQRLRFRNGNTGLVEAVLYDDRGRAYELGVVGIGGTGGGIYLGRIQTGTDDSGQKKRDFPAAVSFVRLRLRSDVPFDANRIEWIPEIQK